MKRKILGTRTQAPAFFDMSGHIFLTKGVRRKTHLFTIGDKAVIFAYLSNWRYMNPKRKLILLVNPAEEETVWAAQVPTLWMMTDIVDEVWRLDVSETLTEPPEQAENLYCESLQSIWSKLRQLEPLITKIRPDKGEMRRTLRLLEDVGIPRDFITVQPLFDAHREPQRNVDIAWWLEVIIELAKATHVVVTGNRDVMSKFPELPIGTTPFWQTAPSVYQSLCVISAADAHVGGETGTTRWAGLFDVPLLCVFEFWNSPSLSHKKMKWDLRPISCGNPVRHFSPETDPTLATTALLKVLRRSV